MRRSLNVIINASGIDGWMVGWTRHTSGMRSVVHCVREVYQQVCVLGGELIILVFLTSVCILLAL